MSFAARRIAVMAEKARMTGPFSSLEVGTARRTGVFLLGYDFLYYMK